MNGVVRLFLLPAILLPLGQAAPLQAQEQPPIVVMATSVHYTFGQQAVFEIEVAAEAGVTALYLYLQEEGQARVEVDPVPFEPGTSVRAAYQQDLRAHPFPPFGEVTWWWEVRDGADHRLTTPSSTFQYEDNRFEWQDTASGPVWLHAVVDDPGYVQTALDVAQTSLAQIARQLESPVPEQVDIYLYPSVMDLRAALEMAGREWMGGQARPELGAVLVAIPYDDEYVTHMEREIPHELTHLMVYQAAGPEGYPYVPAWLNEGLAMVNQMRPDPSLEALLERARADGRLIPLRDLCAPFPSDPETALLSYAQSASLVQYIRDRYGSGGIRRLLTAYADGAGCEGGILQALEIAPERLDLAWRAHLMGLTGWTTWLSDNAVWLLLWGLSLLVALPMAGAFRRRGGPPNARTRPDDR